jgi:hypothetical protein
MFSSQVLTLGFLAWVHDALAIPALKCGAKSALSSRFGPPFKHLDPLGGTIFGFTKQGRHDLRLYAGDIPLLTTPCRERPALTLSSSRRWSWRPVDPIV